MTEFGERLDGNVGGAWRVGETVRRATGPWTPAVHALLEYLGRASPVSLTCSGSMTMGARSSLSCPVEWSTSTPKCSPLGKSNRSLLGRGPSIAL